MSSPAVHVFDTPARVALRLQLRSADVSVVTGDVSTTELEVTARRDADAAEVVTVTSRGRGDVTEILVEERKRRSGLGRDAGIAIRVTCPHGTDVDCASGSSDLEVDGELGDLVVKTGSGDVRVAHVRGSARVTGASGDVTIGSIVGASNVQTASGDVSIGPAGGAVSINAVSGDVELRTANAGLSVTSVSGDVHVGALVAGDAKVQSVSGDVELGVAPGTPVWIDAQSVSGDIASGLELEDSVAGDEGAVVELRIRTVSGDVVINRAVSVTSPGPGSL